jgi:hypothetical protein
MAKAAAAKLSSLRPDAEDVPLGYYRTKFLDKDILLPKEARCWDRRDIAKYIRKLAKDANEVYKEHQTETAPLAAGALRNICLGRQPPQAGSLLLPPQADVLQAKEHKTKGRVADYIQCRDESMTLVVRLESHTQDQVPDAVLEVMLAAAASKRASEREAGSHRSEFTLPLAVK